MGESKPISFSHSFFSHSHYTLSFLIELGFIKIGKCNFVGIKEIKRIFHVKDVGSS